MKLIKVLGIGSPFGDDQVGWKVAEVLKKHMSTYVNTPQHLIIESHDRPGMRLIELMSGASAVFIIDAVKSNSEAGTIHRFKNNEIFAAETRFSTHDIGVSQALQLGSALNLLPDNIIVYGIEIDTSESGTILSHKVEHAIELVVVQLKNEIITTYEQLIK